MYVIFCFIYPVILSKKSLWMILSHHYFKPEKYLDYGKKTGQGYILP